MKTIMMIIASTAFAVTSQAALVLDWNMPPTSPVAPAVTGTYVETGANQTVGSYDGALGSTYALPFDATTAFLTRTDATLESISFYGGAYTTRSDQNSLAALVYRGNDAIESLRLQGGASGASSAFSLAFLFDTSIPSSFDGLSYIQAYLNCNNSGATGRWLVYSSSGQLYVSEATLSITSTMAAQTYTSGNWAAWTPDAQLANLPTVFDVAGSSLSDITKLGVYASGSYADKAYSINLFGIQADMVVPEPATSGMLGFGALVTMLFRRRLMN